MAGTGRGRGSLRATCTPHTGIRDHVTRLQHYQPEPEVSVLQASPRNYPYCSFGPDLHPCTVRAQRPRVSLQAPGSLAAVPWGVPVHQVPTVGPESSLCPCRGHGHSRRCRTISPLPAPALTLTWAPCLLPACPSGPSPGCQSRVSKCFIFWTWSKTCWDAEKLSFAFSAAS